MRPLTSMPRRACATLGALLLTTAACAATASSDDGRAAPGSAAFDAAALDGRASLEAAVLDGRSLDGTGNNVGDPQLGAAGRPYTRVAEAAYADGIGGMVDGPPARYVSNRVYNDLGQNVFSPTGLTHWAFVWGQFVDHTIGLAEAGDEQAPIELDPDDPLERFEDDLGGIPFTRDAAAAGTGVDSPRQSVNTVSSFLDAWNVYGGDVGRLEWLRPGPVNGDLSDNDPHLLLADGGYLPTSASRPEEAPAMDLMGRLAADAGPAVIAGDVRANENLGLTAVQTLFAREHNRIVDLLPEDLPDQVRFEIARRVVGAEMQWITYEEYLPALGVRLPAYDGYDPTVDPTLTTEFATVGYRAHSFVHGELEQELAADDAGAGLDALAAAGVEVSVEDATVELAVPLNVAFGNPSLLPQIGLGNVLRGLAGERQYANDELIDDQLRSVLFQVPGPDVADPSACLDGAELPECFRGVVDLGAIDMVRALDHGIPGYNALRSAHGLQPVASFTDLTGEDGDQLPSGLGIDDPAILDYVDLRAPDGSAVEAGDGLAVDHARRSTLAARLAAVYGEVDAVDAFTGMLAERREPGAELGELQLAMWERQFAALRDGDRFFHADDPVLDQIRAAYGIDHRRTLAEVIADNTGGDAVPTDVFHVSADEEDPADEEGAAGEGEARSELEQDDSAVGDENAGHGTAARDQPPADEQRRRDRPVGERPPRHEHPDRHRR